MLVRRNAVTASLLAGALLLGACSSTTETGTGGSSTTAATGSTGTTPGSVPGSTPRGTAPPPEDVQLDAATQAQLTEVFETTFAETGMPGATARVTIGDTTWEQTLGVSDIETDAPFDPEHHARIASITKTFTGTAILMLVDQEQLALDDTLEEFIPGIDNGNEITIANLLGMSSGVWDFTADDELVARFDADPMMAWTPEQTVELIKSHKADFEPGTEVVYCDSNFVLLGLILEQVTGMTAAEAINTMVVEPLGLTNTRFPAPDEPGIPAPALTGYLPPADGSSAAPTVVGDINPQFAWTAGAVTSNLDDLERWGEDLGAGSLLEPDTQALRIQGTPFTGQAFIGYGLGLLTVNDVVGHNGAIIGFSSIVLRYEAYDATITVIGNESTNFSTPATDIGFALLAALYPAQLQ